MASLLPITDKFDLLMGKDPIIQNSGQPNVFRVTTKGGMGYRREVVTYDFHLPEDRIKDIANRLFPTNTTPSTNWIPLPKAKPRPFNSAAHYAIFPDQVCRFKPNSYSMETISEVDPDELGKMRVLSATYLKALQKFSEISVPIRKVLQPAIDELQSLLDVGVPHDGIELDILCNLLTTLPKTNYIATRKEKADIFAIRNEYTDIFNSEAARHGPFPRFLTDTDEPSETPAAK